MQDFHLVIDSSENIGKSFRLVMISISISTSAMGYKTSGNGGFDYENV